MSAAEQQPEVSCVHQRSSLTCHESIRAAEKRTRGSHSAYAPHVDTMIPVIQ